MKTLVVGQAALIAFGLAMPSLAQEGIKADEDGDQFISSDEATSHSERVFDEAVGSETEMTFEQFDAIMQGSETVAAEQDTAGDAETEWDRADADDSGSLTREEWMNWRTGRFDEAAGDEGQVEAGLYESLYASGMSGVDAGGDTPIGADADAVPSEPGGADGAETSSPAADAGTAGGGAIGGQAEPDSTEDAPDTEAGGDSSDPADSSMDVGEDSSDPEDSGTGATSGETGN